MDLSLIWLRTWGWSSPPVNTGKRKSVHFYSNFFGSSRRCLHQNTSAPQGLSTSTIRPVLAAGKSATVLSNQRRVGMHKFSGCPQHSDCHQLQISFLVGEEVWPWWGWKDKLNNLICHWSKILHTTFCLQEMSLMCLTFTKLIICLYCPI